MTEISYYWQGTTTGDASGNAPYPASIYHANWKTLFTRLDDEGIIDDVDNILLVVGVSGGVTVATGAALVNGWYYRNDAQLSIVIPTPSSDPRIDRIVLQRDLANQTVRAVRLAGTENASPTAPVLTQDNLGIWEVSIAQILITTGGTITVSFNRVSNGIDGRLCSTPLAAIEAWSLIEKKVAVGGEVNFDFTNIPQTFQNLWFVGQVRGTVEPSSFFVSLNGDTTLANYGRQVLAVISTVPTAQATNAVLLPVVGLTDLIVDMADAPTQFNLKIANYSDTVFFKMITNLEHVLQKLTTPFEFNVLSIEGDFWENTDAVNRVLFAANFGTLVAGSTISLYGI